MSLPAYSTLPRDLSRRSAIAGTADPLQQRHSGCRPGRGLRPGRGKETAGAQPGTSSRGPGPRPRQAATLGWAAVMPCGYKLRQREPGPYGVPAVVELAWAWDCGEEEDAARPLLISNLTALHIKSIGKLSAYCGASSAAAAVSAATTWAGGWQPRAVRRRAHKHPGCRLRYDLRRGKGLLRLEDRRRAGRRLPGPRTGHVWQTLSGRRGHRRNGRRKFHRQGRRAGARGMSGTDRVIPGTHALLSLRAQLCKKGLPVS